MVKTNELKKGVRIQLRATGLSGPVGWYATITDNAKGTIRQAEVEGLYTEIGSVYSHDIMRAMLWVGWPDEAARTPDSLYQWVKVEHTPAQLKCQKMNQEMFG